jgi:hypothetical protein
MPEHDEGDALLSMQPASVWERRKRYYLNGYEGVIALWNITHPCKSPGKQPVEPSWQLAAKKRPPDAVRLAPDERALNTGFTTGSFVAVDIDVYVADVVDQIAAMVEAIAGATQLSRIGLPPKTALCYRASRPYHKIQTLDFVMPDGSNARVEILGDGQQLVVDGLHPVTGAPYVWPDQHPFYVPLCELRELTKDAAVAIRDEADRILRGAGAVEKERPNKKPATQRVAAGATPPPPGEGFFRQVNTVALPCAEKWIGELFPAARESANGAWRVKPEQRGRPDVQEDISIHPELGIVDYGLERNMTAIDLVVEFGAPNSPLEAALWLCSRLGIDPVDLGYQPRQQQPRHAPSEPPDRIFETPPGVPPSGPPPPIPVIRVRGGKRHIAADQGIAAMRDACVPFYRRDRELVQVCRLAAKDKNGTTIHVPGVAVVEPPILGRALGLSARWEKVNNKGILVPIDPPEPVVKQIGGMIEAWPFPVLSGVIGTPTLRRDFSLLMHEGHDAATGLYLMSGGLRLPPIAEQPTRDEASAAINLLMDLLVNFPFVGPEHCSAALSLLMTAVLRGAFPVAPLHLVDAPAPGSGKSYLADLAALIATGEPCAVFAQGEEYPETEKRLIGAALAGFPIINLDNCRKPLKGDFLCQVAERPLLSLRALGASEIKRVVNVFTMLATANNAVVVDDMVRRILRIALDPNMESPEEREFSFAPDRLIAADRGVYVAAVLKIARAYVAAGMPDKPKPLPSYEPWSDLVRGSLMWLDQPDPLGTMQSMRDSDPVAIARADVFAAWADELGIDILDVGNGVVERKRYQTADLIALAERSHSGADENGNVTDIMDHPKLHRALLAVAAGSGLRASRIDNGRLGYWLRGQQGRVSEGVKLLVDRSDKKRPRWYLAEARS